MFPAGVLARKLTEISRAVQQSDYRLAISNEHEFFDCSVSLHVFPNSTLRAVSHIPVLLSDYDLPIYQYLPVPFALHNSQPLKYAEVLFRDELFLMVNPQRRTYLQLNQHELAACPTLGQRKVCKLERPIRSYEAKSCLLSLYNLNLAQIADLCTITTTFSIAQAWALDQQTYLVFHPSPQRFTIVCKNQTQGSTNFAAEQFAGLREIWIPDECVGQNQHLTLFPHKQFSQSRLLFALPALAINESTLISDPTSEDLFSPIDKEIKLTVKDPAFVPVSSFDHSWHAWTSRILILGCVVGLIGLYCFLCRRFRRLRNRTLWAEKAYELQVRGGNSAGLAQEPLNPNAPAPSAPFPG